MKSTKRINLTYLTTRQVVSDFISAIIANYFYFLLKSVVIQSLASSTYIYQLYNFSNEAFIITLSLLQLFIFYLSGYYKDVVRKSVVRHFGETFFSLLIFSMILFLFLLNKNYLFIESGVTIHFVKYIIFTFAIVFTPRLIWTLYIQHQMDSGKIGFNTLLIGSNKRAEKIFTEYSKIKALTGNNFLGFIDKEKSQHILSNYLPYLGDLTQLKNQAESLNIDEVIVTLKPSCHTEIREIITTMKQQGILIRMVPDINLILEGTVKMSNIKGLPLITIKNSLMPVWQHVVKNILDYAISFLVLILLAPLMLIIALGVRVTSKGPIFFTQTRIGKHQKPFQIIKFRSMYVDAESNGPSLSSPNDARITSVGRLLRKYHMDELPQFINILKGNMSLVGPRPERQFFIDQIIQKAPHYVHLFQIKPGITSWGMVKFGYAESVDQMVDRCQYDIIYLENMSLLVDVKIILYTVRTLILGKGQ